MSHNIGTAEARRETAKALLVYIEDLDEEVWIPKSQIHDDSEVYEDGTSGDLIVTDWFAREKGWE